MRFFHLADLHIGKTLGGFSLLEDQRAILGQIAAHARREKPEAVLIAGDIYDKPIPGTEAVLLFDDFLTDLSSATEHVLVVCGNHDSPERLGFAGRLLHARGIHLYGRYDGTLHTVTLMDAHGPCHFHMLPFIKPVHVRAFFSDKNFDTYDSAMRAAVAAHQVDPSVRNVLMAHQFVVARGGTPERSASEIEPVGGLSEVDASIFDAWDYVALGHLHGPQRAGRPSVRYAGSPLKYSFSECHHRKRLTVVTLREKGAEATVEELPLTPLHDLRRIAGPMDELTSPAVLAAGDPMDYIHATLTDPHETPDALARMRGAYPNLVTLAFDNARTRLGDAPTGDAAETAHSPLSLFADFYTAQNGEPPSPTLLSMMESLLTDTEDMPCDPSA